MTFEQLDTAVQAEGLEIHGSLHPRRSPAANLTDGTLILLGTAGSFWSTFTASAEYLDAEPDPVDRWSLRVVEKLAKRFAATPYFPFGGPPFAPFINWALASGRAFTSPSQMLVHDKVGLMISFRGALHFDDEFDIPPPILPQSPCKTCIQKSCLTACPVAAFTDGGPYDLQACHSHLDSPEGADCMAQGCRARRACPLSLGASRDFSQNSHHMSYFHSI
ncbi:ferredoxin [Sedimentitalea sp. CY04]|uniref:Ferredoxin n=1 Tax=Parasedimentitalea denitrificans TaxID=2211118 RepID=A0ABX0WDN1_9RHOB|nr:ferredoxin [Sedimentitalea sp. CY04]NIZ62840.1 ferredoxin [Sedimentitalea sp. CY04]